MKIDKDFLKRLKNKFAVLKKYNYDVNKVIGVKGKERYILYVDKKLIRIYRGKLKSTPLLCTYIPIENAIFYSFRLERNVIDKIDLDSFVETKVYDEAGVDETEEYVIKYEIVEKLKDDKYVEVETVIVPSTFLKSNYKDILKETGYIDYVSFPAFSYRALYEEGILKEADDVFVVILNDKIFLTFYSEGDLVYIQTLSGGLDRLYNALSKLKIKNFNYDLLKKILTKKGFSDIKYSTEELVVLEIIKNEFSAILSLIKEQIDKYLSLYDVSSVERVFITSEIGEIPDLDMFASRFLHLEAFNFEFYEKYNLDKLPVDPFLFLGMLETHYAYEKNDQTFNFSLFLREPTFIYRPSGKLIIASILTFIISGSYPFYMWLKGKIYESKNEILSKKVDMLNAKISALSNEITNLAKSEKILDKKILAYKKEISDYQKFIQSVYKFKFSYLPKSQELVEITNLMNKNKVYAKSISFSNRKYVFKVYSYKENSISNLIKDLSDNGFGCDFDKIEYKNGKYNSIIRITE